MSACRAPVLKMVFRRSLTAIAVLLPLWLTGCVDLPQQSPVSPGDLAWVRSGAGLLSQTDNSEIENPSALLHVTDEMRHYAQEVTHGRFGVSARTTALAGALGADSGLHLRYDTDATLTAEQAFAQKRVNCLSYTMLFVALARTVGIRTQFNEVEVPPIWGLGDATTSLLYRHVNARVELLPPLAMIVDVNLDAYDPRYEQHVISDDDAAAQFYNNRAVELRLQQHYADALRYQLRAIDLAPNGAYLWSNLASLYLRDGNSRAARIAVTHSLQLDDHSIEGYNTAALVYQQLGEPALAARFRKLAQYYIDQNPYYHYQLALAALDRQDEHQAYIETRRAIQLDREEPRFYFLQAVLLEHQGKIRQADESMQTALSLAHDPAQQQRYRYKFAQLTGHS
ncbi:MAG: hypothetical protein ACRESS_02850 [Stenotrophobium sp.]